MEPVNATANFSYAIDELTGKGFLCVGDAHRFIDPFFALGVHLALSEAEKAAEFIAGYLDGEGRDLDNPFAAYQRICDQGMDVVQDLIDAFWNNPLGWGYMLHYTEHGGDMLDTFGGMIYEEEPSPALPIMRRMNEKAAAQVPSPAYNLCLRPLRTQQGTGEWIEQRMSSSLVPGQRDRRSRCNC